MAEEHELQQAKAAFKQALADEDPAALLKAEREIIRLKKLRAEKTRTFLHDSGMLVAWGESTSPLQ